MSGSTSIKREMPEKLQFKDCFHKLGARDSTFQPTFNSGDGSLIREAFNTFEIFVKLRRWRLFL